LENLNNLENLNFLKKLGESQQLGETQFSTWIFLGFRNLTAAILIGIV
jgi:hypothetical protein